jgi:ubiquinone/menaquinone biosynthesis C-methylase UbiE
MKIEDIDHIYRDGRHYDCLFPEPYMPFWMDLIKAHGSPVLELGCGTGKITIPIAKAGFEILGLDNSEGMLAHARKKSRDLEMPIRFAQSDMVDFSLDQKFKTILLPSNNLAHLMGYREALSCFCRVCEHLDDDGVFVIDAFVPSLSILTKSPEEEEVLSKYDDPDGTGEVVVTAKAVYEPDSQIRRVKTVQKMPDGSSTEGHLNMRMYFPQELEALLDFAGFEILEKYGSYEKEPFSSKSIKQLIVAKKSSSVPARCASQP